MIKLIILQYGSAVKFPGSGGAVIGLCLDKLKKVSKNFSHLYMYNYLFIIVGDDARISDKWICIL